MSTVSIIDYGMGNLLSVKRAFESQGIGVCVVTKPEEIISAERLVLPGVGAFRKGMHEIEERGFVEPIKEYCKHNRPFMGICLGMQMLLDESEEFGLTSGLAIIPGRVVKFSEKDESGQAIKIPHIGWNTLKKPNDCKNWNDSILKNIDEDSFVYFVHSYCAVLCSWDNMLAFTDYGANTFAAVIHKGNCYGVQFHPEKSGEIGLKIIQNFLQLS